VETLAGQTRTVTYTPTSPPAGDNTSAFEQTSTHGLNTGQAVGLTIGLVALIAVIGAVIFFCVRKRRQNAAAEPFDDVRGDSSSGPLPKRTMSETSRYMLGTDGRQVVEGWEPEDEVAGSRRSRLVPVDPRLDPFAPVYQRGDGSKSRESVATIRDDHDYSRRVHGGRPILRATNPDE
jgi:cell wall integrity and stress response component